jgi:tRNA threonylcarbamoyladenosine biosynthesis protein TsaE
MKKITIQTAEAMLAFGKQLAQANLEQCVIYLKGQLGAGKTTLVRGILQGMNHTGPVKSPTYTLVETYSLPTHTLYHWDMYRLTDPTELENIGIRDYMQHPAWWLIEWPEHVQSVLPTPDLIIELKVVGEAREISLTPKTEKGKLFLSMIFSLRHGE